MHEVWHLTAAFKHGLQVCAELSVRAETILRVRCNGAGLTLRHALLRHAREGKSPKLSLGLESQAFTRSLKLSLGLESQAFTRSLKLLLHVGLSSVY